jgi:hypothetical protein
LISHRRCSLSPMRSLTKAGYLMRSARQLLEPEETREQLSQSNCRSLRFACA